MRFKGLDLNLLMALDVLIEQQSVTRAAEKLHISQPAISAALARLRQHFGDPLLVQHGKQMIPTAYATRMQARLKSILTDVDALISTPASFDPASSTTTFRLMASDFILVAVLGELLPAIEAIAPDVRFTITPTSEHAIAMLENGDIDLLMTPDSYISDKHPSVPLFEERHVVAGWTDSPLMQRPITREDLTTASFISAQIGRSQNSSFAINELEKLGIRLNNTLSISYFAVVPQLLVGSTKLAILHETLARKSARHLPITYQPLPVDIPSMREVVQVHRARAQDPALMWLIAQFAIYGDQRRGTNDCGRR